MLARGHPSSLSGRARCARVLQLPLVAGR